MNFIIFALSLIGLWISVYFTGVYYKWFQPNVFWIPQICQLKESSCMMIIDTPRAKLFGAPNSVFGMGLYAYLIFNLFVSFPAIVALTLLSFAVIRSVYLAYSLVFITKVPCPLCFTSHVINIILLFLVFQTSVSG